jgi:hypothetical protein
VFEGLLAGGIKTRHRRQGLAERISGVACESLQGCQK